LREGQENLFAVNDFTLGFRWKTRYARQRARDLRVKGHAVIRVQEVNMSETNEVSALEKAQAQRDIAELVASGALSSVRIGVSRKDAKSMRDISRWEKFSSEPEANLELLGRY
jgi:hypothetical protein